MIQYIIFNLLIGYILTLFIGKVLGFILRGVLLWCLYGSPGSLGERQLKDHGCAKCCTHIKAIPCQKISQVSVPFHSELKNKDEQ